MIADQSARVGNARGDRGRVQLRATEALPAKKTGRLGAGPFPESQLHGKGEDPATRYRDRNRIDAPYG